MVQLKLKNIGFGVLTGYGVTLLLLLILAAVMTFTKAGEGLLEPFVTVANLLGIFVAGLWSVRRVTSGGWFIGGITGVICPLILRLIGTIIYEGGYFTPQLLPAVLLGFLSGALGGIVGINMGYKARKKGTVEKYTDRIKQGNGKTRHLKS